MFIIVVEKFLMCGWFWQFTKLNLLLALVQWVLNPTFDPFASMMLSLPLQILKLPNSRRVNSYVLTKTVQYYEIYLTQFKNTTKT